MAGSYRTINYALRPAKAIERRMLCDLFQRLTPFGMLNTYRYVGLGSIYFTDFNLFHRVLGIDDMLSIERDEYAAECFEFNKPYKCINLDFRAVSEAIPNLDWTRRQILWFDYDGHLDREILADVRSVCARAISGTVLMVTVNANPDSAHKDETRSRYLQETGEEFDLAKYRLREMRNRIGQELPPEVTGQELRGHGVAALSHRIMRNVIVDALAARNGVLACDERVTFSQLVNFHYKDGALMLTIGGLFHTDVDRPKVQSCAFEELQFYRADGDAYKIQAPCLTLKEMNYLNTQLPLLGADKITIPGVPPADIENYARLYRYFPTFTEAVFS